MARPLREMKLTSALVSTVKPYSGPYLPESMDQRSDGDFEQLADAILGARQPSGALFVFAFGSLMWKPGEEFGDRQSGAVRGWHRAFCLGWDRAYRGNPENPGLMLSLARGGQCRGVVFELAGDGQGLRANLLSLLRREPPYCPWVTVKTETGSLRAITFASDHNSDLHIGGLSDEQIADALAKSSGQWGSMAEYLYNTVKHLEAMGIHDRHLWRMQELVADRIAAVRG